MTGDLITQLRQATPEDRILLLQQRYKKNRTFFQKKFSGVHAFIERTPTPYTIEITPRFLQIVHSESGQSAHQGIELDQLAEVMGQGTHEGWIDLVDFNVGMNEAFPLHNGVVRSFLDGMAKISPKSLEHLQKGHLGLKKLSDGRQFSPPVVFLGIFHGLHIVKYLEQTDLSTAMFIEPDPERFELSCYFLDYEAIEHRFGELNIYCGTEPKSFLIKRFFLNFHVTRHIWLRILPGYESGAFAPFVQNINALFQAQSYSKVMLDQELAGMANGIRNLKSSMDVLSARPRPLTRGARIAIVASGPSLDKDIRWLKSNAGNFVIFAVHSAVKVLRAHDIQPDFQFSLEMGKGVEVAERLELQRDVPLVSYYKSDAGFLSVVDQPCLCVERYKSNPVRFSVLLEDTHPSTTNLAFSFACFLKPSEIYLLGCDFGSIVGGASHAADTFQQHHAAQQGGEQVKHDSTNQKISGDELLVPANFAETGKVNTNPFLNRTRISIEKAIQKLDGAVTVCNLSDGARVDGAIPLHSADAGPFGEYTWRERDIENIRKAFRKARKGETWTTYPDNGAQVLDFLRQELLRNLELPGFSWKACARQMDKAVELAMHSCSQRSPDDFRMEAYVQVFLDIFSIWYAFLILLDREDEAQVVYSEGLELLKNVLAGVSWPSELDWA